VGYNGNHCWWRTAMGWNVERNFSNGGTAERDAALMMLERIHGEHQTVGAEQGLCFERTLWRGALCLNL